MRLFDLHCDSLTECFKQNLSLYDNDKTTVVLKDKSNYIQAFALYSKNDMPTDKLRDYFIGNCEYLDRQSEKICNFGIIDDKLPVDTEGKVFGIRTVENCQILENLDNFDLFLKYNIFVASLTHNEENCLAGGALSDVGLTSQGKRVIDLFDRHKITLDISHLNDKSCFEVLSYTENAVIATHSNARAICDNKRNITDEIFTEIKNRGGVVGINLHCPFLGSEEPSFDDIIKHIYHFLSQGGEDNISLGCDMDGAIMPPQIKNLDGLENLYQYMLKLNFSERLIDKIFYKNAYDFFAKRRGRDVI